MRLGQRDVRRAGEVGTHVGPVDGLLAGDPAAPRHRAAGAVHLGAVEAGEGVDDLAVAGHLDRGRAALGHGVVRLGGVAEGRAGLLTSWLRTSMTLPRRRPAERGHAVVAAGQHGAVVERHRRLGVVERPVREPRRQVQAHDAVAGVGAPAPARGRVPPPPARRRPGPGTRRTARPGARQRGGGRPGGGSGEEGATVEPWHGSPPGVRAPAPRTLGNNRQTMRYIAVNQPQDSVGVSRAGGRSPAPGPRRRRRP